MKYKTYKCNSFNVYTIKTDKFKTVHMEVIFRKKVEKDELPEYSFLADMLSESCKKYPKRKDLITRFEELYKMSVYGTTVKTGNVLNTSFIIDFIDPSYIDADGYLENVIKMPFEIIGNPNVINDEFPIKQFNLVKERIIREIEGLSENPSKMAINEALQKMDSNTPTSYRLLGTKDDIEKITPASLYKLYKKMFKECTCDVFIIGNINMDDAVTYIKKYFKHRYINKEKLDLIVNNKEAKKVIKGTKDSNNIQANLVMIYNLSDLTKEEKDITFQVFNYIYGNGGLTSKLYKKVREENSLCYGISSIYLKYDNLLIIQVALDNKNINKAISLIQKCTDEMKSGKFLDKDIEDAKMNLNTSLDLAYDNNVAILNNYVFNIYDNLVDLDKRKELINKVTKEEIEKVAKKLKLNTIYTLMGKGDN